MAFVRRRRRKTGVFYAVIEKGKSRTAKKDRAFANRWATEIERQQLLRESGLSDDRPTHCRWTLGELRDRDLEDARDRGLRTVAWREQHWRSLIRMFGEDTPLTALTRTVLQEGIRFRGRTVGPATVNRDFRSVLSPALAFARRNAEESGYTGDPFRDFPPLNEKAARRKPIPLSRPDAEKLIAAAWQLARDATPRWRSLWEDNAAMVELWLRTGVRYRQVLLLPKTAIRGGNVVFEAQKGGKPTIYPLRGALRFLLTRNREPGPWVFPGARPDRPRDDLRTFWRKLLEEAGIPGLRFHDLRHTASRQALKDGQRVRAVQGMLGHRTPRTTEGVYLELYPELSKPVAYRASRGPLRTAKVIRSGRSGKL